MKVTAEFIRNQQASQPELIRVRKPALAILSPKLRVEYGVWSARENDQETRKKYDSVKQNCGPALWDCNLIAKEPALLSTEPIQMREMRLIA